MSTDDELERLRGAAVEVAQEEDEAPPAGGFADVLARASMLASAPGTPDDGLERLIIAARRLAELDVEERTAEGVPMPRRRVTQRWVAPSWVLAVAAASALLVIGGLSWAAERAIRNRAAEQAASTARSEADAPVEHKAELEPARAAVHSPAQPPDEPDEVITPPPAIEPVAPRERRGDLDERLRMLAEQAEAALARGELERADDILARLCALGGRHRRVELAYGDRFTIAHRRGIIGEQTVLWRAYLARFPEGRFADDARAGLCRHADADGRAGCWTEYLVDFPAGAYRAAAVRAIDLAGTPR